MAGVCPWPSGAPSSPRRAPARQQSGETKPPMPIDHIGRYQIEAELGKGAMGVVYRATDPNIGRTVALKTLRVDVHGIENDEMTKRFQAEARNAGVLSHPNIVTIYDAQEIEGTFYIAMEFIEGQTLQELLKNGTLPIPKMIDIVRQVCAGLDYAHARGIVHRDIKPANIMIQADGTVKIMDFGIAKGQGSGMTSTGQVLGTPNYMSPEQVKGKPLDGRSDLFSLGVVIYEMLTGARPFVGDNVTTIIYKIVNEQPAAPVDVNNTVHPGLNAAVMKALSKNREERYQSGADLKNDLENFKKFGVASTATTKILTGPIAAPSTPHPEPARPSVPAPAAAAVKPARATAPTVVTAARKPVKAAPAPVAKKPPVAMIAGVVSIIVLAVVAYFGWQWKTYKAHAAAQPVASAPAPPVKSAASATPLLDETPSEKPAGDRAIPAARGELRISSAPEGARFVLDGHAEPNYVTPYTAAKISSGAHTVEFTMDGYQSVTRRVSVAPGSTAFVSATLNGTGGFVNVRSTPEAAAIFLDGNPTGVFTPGQISVTPGQHNISVRKNGYKDQTMSAVLGAGQTLPMNFTLHGGMETASASQAAEGRQSGTNVPTSNVPPANTVSQSTQQPVQGNPFGRVRRFFGGDHGMVILRSMPRGAEIWVNGRPTEHRTPVKFPAPVGKYRISLRMPGYKAVTRDFQVDKNKTVEIDEILQRQ